MLKWLRFVGPGLALLFGGAALTQAAATQEIGGVMAMLGMLYLFIIGPIYKRRWRADRKAHDWHLLREAKKKYQ